MAVIKEKTFEEVEATPAEPTVYPMLYMPLYFAISHWMAVAPALFITEVYHTGRQRWGKDFDNDFHDFLDFCGNKMHFDFARSRRAQAGYFASPAERDAFHKARGAPIPKSSIFNAANTTQGVSGAATSNTWTIRR